jgi:Fe-S-cluster containining protein
MLVSTSALDCQACGACCHGDDGWVHVDREDDPRIAASPALAAIVVMTKIGGAVRRSLRMIDGHCAALVSTAAGVTSRVTCTVYADRPGVCRVVEAGSDECRAARRRRGVEPVASWPPTSAAK